MADLVKTNESRGAWNPVKINQLDNLLIKVISSGHGYKHPYALRRNIAYNLQHIEFLHKCLNDIKLSSVIITQTWKSIILVGCGVIESLLYYLLVKKSAHSTTEWELKIVMPGNQKKMDGIQTKVDSHVYTKLSSPKAKQMNFDTIIQKAKSNKILGSNPKIYSKLDKLRKLRNKVHLQIIENHTDTDWNSFNKSEINDMDEILYSVFTSNIFRPSAHEKLYFQYLYDYYKT
jgi:hypothetical protein